MQGQVGQGQTGGLGMGMTSDNSVQAQHFMQQSMSVGGARTVYGNGQPGKRTPSTPSLPLIGEVWDGHTLLLTIFTIRLDTIDILDKNTSTNTITSTIHLLYSLLISLLNRTSVS